MDRQEAKKRIEKLRAVIDHHRYLYHVLDRQELSDEALDSLKKELFDLEQKYPEFITSDSPTQRVAGKPLEGFTKVAHPGRMISLNDAFSEQDMQDWLKRLENHLGKPYKGGFYCDLKMDGLAIELRYKNGLLVQASTRGDGTTGEDVTQNIRTVDAVPLRLVQKGRNVPETVIVRGEVFLSKTEFRRINKALENAEQKTYANPRNLAAGTIRQLDPRVTAGRRLSFFAWSVVGPDGTYGDGFSTHKEEFDALKKWGIRANPYGRTAEDLKDVFKFYREWESKRDKLDYEFDGTVVSVNDNEIYRWSGIVGKAPRGAMAFKFSPRHAQTIVEDIVVQVGRTGVLTPVAYLRPVHIGGTTVSRATLHNLDEIKRLGVRIGDTVIVGRAGDVIPDILKVLTELRPKSAREFHMPKKCPVCGTAIRRQEGQVAYGCPNRDCPAQRRESIYHFVSRNALNIEGVGPQTIDQLMDAGLVQDAADLYTLTVADLLNLERFADVSSKKAVDSIDSRRTVPLHRFIYGLGIMHVGEETAFALARYASAKLKVKSEKLKVDFVMNFFEGISSEELREIPDIGPVVAESIVEWFRRPYNRNLLKKFMKAGLHVTTEKAPAKGKMSGLSFVITGSLDKMSREEAEEKIRELGGKASSSVSKETDYVVVGAEPGSKYDKAVKLKLKIIDEEELLKMLR